jgi:hypothetical protein
MDCFYTFAAGTRKTVPGAARRTENRGQFFSSGRGHHPGQCERHEERATGFPPPSRRTESLSNRLRVVFSARAPGPLGPESAGKRTNGTYGMDTVTRIKRTRKSRGRSRHHRHNPIFHDVRFCAPGRRGSVCQSLISRLLCSPNNSNQAIYR